MSPSPWERGVVDQGWSVMVTYFCEFTNPLISYRDEGENNPRQGLTYLKDGRLEINFEANGPPLKYFCQQLRAQRNDQVTCQVRASGSFRRHGATS